MDGRKNGKRKFDFDDQGNNLEATILHKAARVLFKKMFLLWIYIYIVNIYYLGVQLSGIQDIHNVV